ncbi:MAG: saccharopine dehydrogenase NADP-binding domain-containing protein [Hyphomicrobiales bacterium]
MADKLKFDGKCVLLGFGSIGNASIEILFQHVDLDRDKFFVVSEAFDRVDQHKNHGVTFVDSQISRDNLASELDQLFGDDSGLLVNASVNICSKALIEYCQSRSILYVDTSFEIWADLVGSQSMINNGGRFSDIQNAKKRFSGGATAITCHGANPGIVSHFAKRLVSIIARRELGSEFSKPTNQPEWAELASKLGITSLIVTEMDSQRPEKMPLEKMALNTWSIHGLLEEASEKICVPFGTHEPIRDNIAPFIFDVHGVQYLETPTRSANFYSVGYSPTFGVFSGMIIPHVEAFTIANYFSVRSEIGKTLYQPTSYFCYRPCPAALETILNASQNNWEPDGPVRVMLEEIEDGVDSLGVMAFRENTSEVVWYGSEVSTEVANSFTTCNATSLQVIAGLISSIIYVIQNPREGLLEPEDLDTDFILDIATPYLGHVYSQAVDDPFQPTQTLLSQHRLSSAGAVRAHPRDISDFWQEKS